MEKSQSIKEIASALLKFQTAVKPVKKDGDNPFFKSKYATLDNIIDAIAKPMNDAGLSYSQFPSNDGLTTILMHTSGEWLQAWVKMTPKDNSPQAQGSSITYMRRYALSAVLGIATESDDDGNAASAPVKPASKTAAKPAAKPVAKAAVKPKVEEEINAEDLPF